MKLPTGSFYLKADQAGAGRSCENSLTTTHVRKSSSVKNAKGGQTIITVIWHMHNATVFGIWNGERFEQKSSPFVFLMKLIISPVYL